MIFNWELKVDFEVDGKQHTVTVDRYIITDSRPEKFYRVGAKSGNRDLIKHNGQWVVVSGKSLPIKVLDALGTGIELQLKNQGLDL